MNSPGISLFTGGLLLLFVSACSPKVSTSISKHYDALDYREEVAVWMPGDDSPKDAEVIGTVKIGDSGFSTDCGLDVAIEKAKDEARKAGGNAIKITRHQPPSFWTSSCHRIRADILKIDASGIIKADEPAPSLPADADYALLHVYRASGTGPLISFDLHLGDTVICRVKNKWKETIMIRKEGLNSLWAKTESKAEIPVKIEFGNEYYIRCSVAMGAFVGRPRLELVDRKAGKIEFDAIENKN
ncbi:MAG: hypothetical protein ABS46_11665 [Cytophagaceae bacterium SCN 52-12]|nr:MAG: hypothetical protein ABS46_11665 [Cytophagaceae bacterium SCN 52-12]